MSISNAELNGGQMSRISHSTKVVLETTITLNEAEIRALDGIFGYNVEEFLKVFYERMGRAYVQPFEAGVRSLHESIQKVTRPAIRGVDEARKRLQGGAK